MALWSVATGRGKHRKHLLRIKRQNSRLGPCRCYVLLRKRLLERWPEDREEISLAHRRMSLRLPDKAVQPFAVVMSQRCKHAHIQRLQSVCRVRWVDGNQDPMLLTPVQELHVDVRAVAVDEQQPLRPLRFDSRLLLERAGQPAVAELVARPSVR